MCSALLCNAVFINLSQAVLYVIFATPMMVMLSHRELVGAPPSTRRLLYAMIAVPAIYLLSHQTGFGG
jgi:hypothetical protein